MRTCSHRCVSSRNSQKSAVQPFYVLNLAASWLLRISAWQLRSCSHRLAPQTFPKVNSLFLLYTQYSSDLIILYSRYTSAYLYSIHLYSRYIPATWLSRTSICKIVYRYSGVYLYIYIDILAYIYIVYIYIVDICQWPDFWELIFIYYIDIPAYIYIDILAYIYIVYR